MPICDVDIGEIALSQEIEQRHIMAEGNDITLTLLKTENDFLREKYNELQIKYDYIIKREAILKSTIQGLQKQRDEIEKKYNRLQNELAVSYTATVDKLKETEKKLQQINIKYETEVRTKTETQIEVNSLQRKVISVQEELINAHKELNNAHKELNNAHKELNNAQKEIINVHKELNNLKEQLHENADQIGNIQAQLKDNKEEFMKIINTQTINNQMVRMRTALNKFEKQKFRILSQIKELNNGTDI